MQRVQTKVQEVVWSFHFSLLLFYLLRCIATRAERKGTVIGEAQREIPMGDAGAERGAERLHGYIAR